MPTLRLGTRGSPLAIAQAEETARRLAAAFPELAGAVEIVVIKTSGDTIQDRPLAEIGGKGLFTKEIEEALIDGGVDIAVHSLKDMPTVLPDGLIFGAILPRADVRDAWFGRDGLTLDTLPPGARIGTSSLRRGVQAMIARPDLKIVSFRGNVATRLSKLEAGEAEATMLAMAGLERLGMTDRATAVLEPARMLPAVGQGAIAIECRAADDATRRYLAAINDHGTERRVAAERAMLAVLDGSCRTPIAGLAEITAEGALRLTGFAATPDAARHARSIATGALADAEAIGTEVGGALKHITV